MSLHLRGAPSRWRRLATAFAFTALFAAAVGCTLRVVRPDVLIGAGPPTGISYPLSGAICRLFNLETQRHGQRCSELPSPGSDANIRSLASGRIEMGIVESDVLADAVAGRGRFAASGRATELRILFAAHGEMLTVVARRGSGVEAIAQIAGKRISIGSPGSRQRSAMERVMAALGLTRQDFAEVRELSSAEQNRAFCAGELDVIVYSDSHPDGLIRDVTGTCRGMLVDVGGPTVDRLLAEHRELEHAVIPAGTYANSPADVRTFGVRAVVVASSQLGDDTAYEVVKAVFDNFDSFRRLHPVFETLSIAEMLRVSSPVPVHDGAARYYRERGLGP